MQVELTQPITVDLQSYWLIRGVAVTKTAANGLPVYNVVAEMEIDHDPTQEEIASFLLNNIDKDIASASVLHNFRLGSVVNVGGYEKI